VHGGFETNVLVMDIYDKAVDGGVIQMQSYVTSVRSDLTAAGHAITIYEAPRNLMISGHTATFFSLRVDTEVGDIIQKCSLVVNEEAYHYWT
jgi:hypothetical protein